MLANSNSVVYYAEYTVDEPNSKYACVNFDNPDSLTGEKPFSISGNKYTCKYTGSIQLMLDTECKYLKPECSNGESDENDNGLSGGAIAGIVIGSVVFACFVVLGAYYFIKKRRLQKNITNTLE